MGTILDLLEAVEVFDAESEFLYGIMLNERNAVDLNHSQLQVGEYANNESIMPDYASLDYADEKQRMNPLPPYATPDLKLSGGFYQGFFLDLGALDNGYFELNSRDHKTDELTAKYGDEIFGLNDDNTEILMTDVMDYFAQQVLNKIGLVLQ